MVCDVGQRLVGDRRRICSRVRFHTQRMVARKDGEMKLSDSQREVLLRPIQPHRVQKDEHGMSYVPAYEILAHLNRVFGFENFDITQTELVVVFERSVSDNKRNRDGWFVTYRCGVELTIRDSHGISLLRREGAACGSATNQPDLGEAHDLACKTAQSLALKRACITLGDQFGLSLYNNGSTEALVRRVVPYQISQPGKEAKVSPDAAPKDEVPPGPLSARLGSSPPASVRIPNREPEGAEVPLEADETPARGGILPLRTDSLIKAATYNQMGRLHALAREQEEDVHVMVSYVLGRAVGSLKDLSVEDASRAIKALENERKPHGAAPELKHGEDTRPF